MQSSPSRLVHEHENYFFALEPPLAVRALIVEQTDRIARERELGGRPVKFCCLHVTLCGIGRTERLREPVLPTLQRAAAAVRAATVEVGFDRLTTLRVGGDQHALVLRGTPQTVSALRFLRTAIGHAQYAQGLYLPRTSRFEAHLAARHLPRPIASDIAIDPITWQADGFVLIRSAASRGVHDVVERWPLATA
jgi:RNA 2',3'-cyclic 3'-phosphodiesterase